MQEQSIIVLCGTYDLAVPSGISKQYYTTNGLNHQHELHDIVTSYLPTWHLPRSLEIGPIRYILLVHRR